MGCAPSSAIVIDLDRKNSFFFGGETVTGTIHLYVASEKLEANDIDVTIIGEIGYITNQTRTVNGRTTKNSSQHEVKFLSLRQILVRPELGQDDVEIAKGKHSWPFQIQLPENVPPTFNQPQAYPHVRYYIQALIDKAWYRLDKEENKYITVFPRVNILHQPYCNPTTFGNHNRKDVVFTGRLNKLGFVPNESIQVTLEVDNSRQAFIKQVDVVMIKAIKIGPYTREIVMLNYMIPEMMRRGEPQFTATFDITVPPGRHQPTCQYQGGLQQVISVSVNYMLRFDVNVEGIFDDFKMVVPFTMGAGANSNP